MRNRRAMEMHWIVTLQWADGARISTLEGIITPSPGATRQDLFRAAVATAEEDRGVPRGSGVVLFFDLAPNRTA